MGYIYKITNKINGKVYIGQTKLTIEERWKYHLHDFKYHIEKEDKRPLYSAFKKYGIDNFIIEKVEDCSNDVLDKREIYYIDKFASYGNTGYNATRGGDGGSTISQKEIDNIILLWNSGKSVRDIFNESSASYDSISKILKRNCHLSNDNLYLRGMSTIEAKHYLKKSIICYDKNMKIVGIFSSIRRASYYCIKNKITPSTNIKGISTCISNVCQGIKYSVYGYIWKFTDFDIIDNYCEIPVLDIPIIVSVREHKPVIQLNMDNIFVEEHWSCVSAAKKLGISKDAIIRVATPRYKEKSAYGNRFMYLEDYQKLHPEYVSKFKK